MPSTCSMPAAMAANSSSVPLKTARTRRIVSALSTRTEGSSTPGLDRYSSGNDTRGLIFLSGQWMSALRAASQELIGPRGAIEIMPQEMRGAPPQNRAISAGITRKLEPLLKVCDRDCHWLFLLRSAWQWSSLWALIRGMRGASWIVSLAVFSTLPIACGGSSSKSEWPKGNVVFADANNYTAMAHLQIPTVQTASGADLMVCWDGIKKDLLCHDVVAPDSEILNVGFAKIPRIDPGVLADQLAVGQFDTNLVLTYREFHTVAGSTCANLSQFV